MDDSPCVRCGRPLGAMAADDCTCRGAGLHNKAQPQHVVPGWRARPGPERDNDACYWHPSTGWTKWRNPRHWGLQDHGSTPYHHALINKHKQPLYRVQPTKCAPGFASPFPDPTPEQWTRAEASEAEGAERRARVEDLCAGRTGKGASLKRAAPRKETRAASQLRKAAATVRGGRSVAIPVFKGPPRPGPGMAWNGEAWVPKS